MSLGKPAYRLLDGTIIDFSEVVAVYPVQETTQYQTVPPKDLSDMPEGVHGPVLKGEDVFVLSIVLRSGHKIDVVSEVREDLHDQRGELLARVFNMKGVSL